MAYRPLLPRSILFVPADRPDRAEKAAAAATDAVCLDLEDGVAAAAKDTARVALADAAAKAGDSELWVRINAELESVSHDLAALPGACSTLVLPKTRSLEHVALLQEALDRRGHAAAIVAMIEDAAGLRGIEQPGPVLSRLRAVCPGTEDLSGDLACAPDGPAVAAALDRLAVAAAATGVGLLGFPGSIGEFRDTLRLSAALERGRASGSAGAFLIHPAQVDAANRIFAPSDAELAWARAAVAGYEAAAAEGKGAVAVEGRMVDRPVWLRARAMLDRARRA